MVALCPTFGTADCSEVFAHEEPNGWINYKYDIHFDPQWEYQEGNENGPDAYPSFVTVLSDPHTSSRFRQVVLVSGGGNQERTFLTRGNGEVDKILSWATDGYVYYLATLPGDAGTRHLFR